MRLDLALEGLVAENYVVEKLLGKMMEELMVRWLEEMMEKMMGFVKVQ